jgi:hypothetical protein
MAKFTPEMRKAVHQLKPPYKNLIIDFVEHDAYIGVRIYENQVMSMSQGQHVSVMEYLHLLRTTIESFGVKCFFDGAKGDPPRSIN